MAKNLIKLNKSDALALFDRVIDCIKKQEKGFFVLKKLRQVHGYCEWEDGIILDYRRDFIPTIIHECIHLLEPDWSEAQVMYSESRIINTVTEDDIIKLLLYFVKKL